MPARLVSRAASLARSALGVLRGHGAQGAAPEAPPPPDAVGPGPFLFIPRDGGLFSVLNHLLGNIHSGRRSYPLFEPGAFRKWREGHRMFAYFGPEGTNSWFEFFEPLRYGEGDRLHEDLAAISALPFSEGALAAEEFRVPEATRRLYASPGFGQWRREVHASAAGLIRPVPALRAQVEGMLARMPGRRIGVHVRHPSHMVEQGRVYYADYFAVLDPLLREHPESRAFLATDNDMALAVFRHRYGERILCHEGIARSPADDVLRWAYALAEERQDDMGFVSGEGFQSHYRVARLGAQDAGAGIRAGREAVLDLFTLAGCHEFVCTLSNFTLTCSYLNPAQVQRLVAAGPRS